MVHRHKGRIRLNRQRDQAISVSPPGANASIA